MNMRKKKIIRREDCVTDEQKLAYSKQQYERHEAAGRGKPSDIFSVGPPETEDWHQPEYHIMVAARQRAQPRLLRRGK
jgi:hypothetical protein